jgi:hypothetical protein
MAVTNIILTVIAVILVAILGAVGRAAIALEVQAGAMLAGHDRIEAARQEYAMLQKVKESEKAVAEQRRRAREL